MASMIVYGRTKFEEDGLHSPEQPFGDGIDIYGAWNEADESSETS